MNIVRTLLKPAARVAALHASQQGKSFLAAHRQTRAVQDALLDRMLRAHEDTAFGHDHGFGRIRGWADFTRAVPVATYERLRPYVDRVFAGETTALLPAGEPVLMFSRTSGTTGKPKHIPVTRRFLADVRRGWNVFGLNVLSDHPEAWLRPILQISSPTDEVRSPTGLPCGAISGMLAATQKRIVRRMYVVPPAVTAIRDPDARYYTTLRCGVTRDVAIITTANPSSAIKLVEVGQKHVERLLRDLVDGTLSPPGDGVSAERLGLRLQPNRALARRIETGLRDDGALLPKHFWDLAFMTHWTAGTLKLYLPRLRRLFGRVAVRDIGLLASEGRISLPLADENPAGVAEITGNVLEFVPAGDYGADNPPTLRPDELEVGQEYFVVLSNWAGLWRYSLDDRVRVTGRLGQSPLIEFLSRGLYTANITGEKITEHQVVEAMRQACRPQEVKIERFLVQGRFTQTPYYELRVEANDGLDLPKLAARMDESLAALNVEYESKRQSGRLGPIRPVALAPGTLAQRELETIRRRGGRSEQYKHQYLLTEVIADDPKLTAAK